MLLIFMWSAYKKLTYRNMFKHSYLVGFFYRNNVKLDAFQFYTLQGKVGDQPPLRVADALVSSKYKLRNKS